MRLWWAANCDRGYNELEQEEEDMEKKGGEQKRKKGHRNPMSAASVLGFARRNVRMGMGLVPGQGLAACSADFVPFFFARGGDARSDGTYRTTRESCETRKQRPDSAQRRRNNAILQHLDPKSDDADWIVHVDAEMAVEAMAMAMLVMADGGKGLGGIEMASGRMERLGDGRMRWKLSDGGRNPDSRTSDALFWCAFALRAFFALFSLFFLNGLYCVALVL